MKNRRAPFRSVDADSAEIPKVFSVIGFSRFHAMKNLVGEWSINGIGVTAIIWFDHSAWNGDFLRTMTFEQLVRIAEGYSELGMLDDALAQLDQLDAEHQNRHEVLRLKVDILLRKQNWKDALRLSLGFCAVEPSQPYGYVHAAFCLHELGRTSEAKQTLLDGPAALLDEPVYYYNLACYDTVLGNLEQAKVYLRASFRLDKSFRELAKSDPDLKQIRDDL